MGTAAEYAARAQASTGCVITLEINKDTLRRRLLDMGIEQGQLRLEVEAAGLGRRVNPGHLLGRGEGAYGASAGRLV